MFRLEHIDQLLKAVRATMNLEELWEEKTIEDKMFEGLEDRCKSVFPIHKSVWGLMRREWKHPDRVYFQKTHKRKYPFEEETASWGRPPKLDEKPRKNNPGLNDEHPRSSEQKS